MKEIWKDIKGFEGCYQVSNFGSVRGVDRIIERGQKGRVFQLEVVLAGSIDQRGYRIINLMKSGRATCRRMHILVWDAFGIGIRDGRRINVDHIDENKLNNRIDNLQLLSNRDNKLKSNSIGRLGGCYKNKKTGKYKSEITINYKRHYIGYFNTEQQALEAYIEARKKFNV